MWEKGGLFLSDFMMEVKKEGLDYLFCLTEYTFGLAFDGKSRGLEKG